MKLPGLTAFNSASGDQDPLCDSCYLLQLAGALIKHKAPKETAIAVVPMGTANDFATAAGIPDDPWEALQLSVHDTAYPVDVGLVNDEVSLA